MGFVKPDWNPIKFSSFPKNNSKYDGENSISM